MADNPIKPPGSITAPADEGNERIAEISNVNRAISNMQQKVNQELAAAQVDVGQFEGIEDVQNSMIKVLNTLNTTVGSLGQGFAKIAADTGRASADAIKQYGKAIGSDIGLNKQNIVATALAQTSPIFGYFAAKFVETDVFQNAKEKMKTNISHALGGITSKFKEGLGLLHRAKAKGEKEKPIKAPAGAVPKMQTGGYVQKEGLAYLHPAEVVVPIDKILGKIDESIEITQELAKISRRAQLHSLARMGTYVKSVEHLNKVGLFKGFLRAYKEVQEQYQEPADIRQLRALLAIQDALGAQIGTWQQVWQKMLVEHPFFRQVAFAMKGIGTVFSLPFKFVYSVFKSRGGYQTHLSKARNPMKAMVENIGLVYTEGMWRLDNIALFTKATAQATRDLTSALTGKKYAPLTGVPTGVWSFANLAKRLGGLIIGKRTARQKSALKELYGGHSAGRITGFLPKMPKDAEDEFKMTGAMRVSEIHIEEFIEKTNQYMLENKKSQQKLLGYTSDMSDVIEGEYKEIKQMNRRQRRKSIFGWFTGLGGSIKNLLGTALGILSGGIIPWLMKKALGFVTAFAPKLVSALAGVATSLMTKLFPKGILAAITALLGNPAIWGGLAVGAIGAGVGTAINKYIIEPGQNEYHKNIERIVNKLNKESGAATMERFAGAREYSKEGLARTEALQITGQLGKFATDREKNKGWFGADKIFDIQSGQQSFMNKNMSEYLKYGPAQVEKLRSEWIKTYGKTATGKEGYLYGQEREADFLKFLQAKGKVRTPEQVAASFEAFKRGLWERGGLTEKGKIVAIEAGELAEKGAAKVTAGAKIVKDAVVEGFHEVVKEGKVTGQKLENAVAQSTTVVSNTIQNTASTVNNAAQRARDKFSEYEYAVMKGDYMLEGF